jgi:hypothetical protein
MAKKMLRALVVSIAAVAIVGTTTASADITPQAAGDPLPVAPYVDMGAWPTPVLSTMASQGRMKGFNLGFVTAFGCKASWFAAFDPRTRWGADQIASIRSLSGGDVKVSFGGASGIELAQACGTVSALAAEYDAVVKAYGLRYIDMDIEGAAVADPTSIQRRAQALATVQRNNPGLKISFTLPVLPTGLTADGVNLVRNTKNAGVNIDMVNVMAMDYYQGPADQGKKAIAAARATFAQLKPIFGLSDAATWKKVGVTPMIGVNDSQNEIFTQEDARELVTFARSVHLGMLSMWSQNRDANACTGALYRCTNISQSPYEFSRIFAGYTG